MAEQTRILIVDDEQSIRDTLKIILKKESFQVEEAKSGQEGLQQTKIFHPHLIILDLGLPDQQGLDILRQLRTWTQTPIIILTATADEESKVQLLDAGADDYLTKPFGSSELLARVRLALRHTGHIEATPIFVSQDLRVDLNQRNVQVSGVEVKLTKTEFELLQRLVRGAGKVIPQVKLLKEIWGVGSQEESHYLRIYIKQLRKKIEVDPTRPVHILTEPGVGYRLI